MLAAMAHDQAIREFKDQLKDVVAVAVRIGAGQARQSQAGHRALVGHPEPRIHAVDAGVDMVAAAQRNIVAPDQALKAVRQVGGFRRIRELRRRSSGC